MKKVIFRVLLSANFALFAGCTFYYSTKSINENAHQYANSAASQEKEIANDVNKYSSIYDNLIQRSSTPDAKPYPDMKATLDKMKDTQSQISALSPKSKDISAKLLALTKGKKSIATNSPELKVINQESEQFRMRYNALLQKYSNQHNDLVNFMKQSAVGQVNIDYMRNEFDRYVKESNKKLAEAKNNIHSKEAKDHVKNIDRADQLLREMETENNLMIQMLEAFKHENSGKKEIWVGPGIRSYTIKQDIQEKSQQLEKLAKEFNSLLH